MSGQVVPARENIRLEGSIALCIILHIGKAYHSSFSGVNRDASVSLGTPCSAQPLPSSQRDGFNGSSAHPYLMSEGWILLWHSNGKTYELLAPAITGTCRIKRNVLAPIVYMSRLLSHFNQ